MRATRVVAIAICLLSGAACAQPLSTAFTYQGVLDSAGQPATGLHDFRFRLYTGLASGSQDGPTLCADNVVVADGRFTVELDFGSVFAGSTRYLEIDARADAGQGCAVTTGFTMLAPRQRLAATPYAMHALSAGSASTASTATNAALFNGQAPSFYTNAANLASGTLPDARLSSNITTLNTAQAFSGVKTFSTPPVFSSAGAPFQVSSSTKVTGLNADLLDGIDSAGFAAASHSHDAGAVSTGTLADARLSTNIPRLNTSNTFTAALAHSGSAQTPLSLVSTNAGGTWTTLSNTSVGGRAFNLIATGSGNSEGVGKLLLRDASAASIRATLDASGRLGLGTTAPDDLLHLAGGDAAARIRNTNDPGGAYLRNTWGTLQLGLYNPGASAWGVIAAGAQRSMLGMDSTGRVGTLTNASGPPAWRNVIDDGGGNATFAGRLDAPTMPGIEYSQTFRDSRNGLLCSVAYCLNQGDSVDLNSVSFTAPADGFVLLLANAAVSVDPCAPGTGAKFELKIDDVGGSTLVNGQHTGRDTFEAGTVNLNWVVPISAGSTKTFKISGLTYDGVGCSKTYIWSTSLQAIFIPKGL